MKHYDYTYRILEEEAKNAQLDLYPVDIDRMARRIAFSVEVTPEVSTLQDALVSTTSRPPQVMAAIEMAAKFRRLAGISSFDSFHHLPDALDEVLGITTFTIECKAISGASVFVQGRPYVLVSTSMKVDGLYVAARQLGNILVMPARKRLAFIEPAHEIGHAPLGPYRRFADYFAMELLVPAEGISVALKEVRQLLKVSNPAIGDVELLLLSRIFGVSFLAIARRCEKVGLLPKGGASLLNRILLEKHGGAEKRAEEAQLPPRPEARIPPMSRSLASCAAMCIKEGKYSLDEASRNLGWPNAFVAQLLGVH